MKTNDKMLIAACGGIFFGACIGVFWASSRGKNTRKKILDVIEEFSDTLDRMKAKVSGNARLRENGKSHGVENEILEYID